MISPSSRRLAPVLLALSVAGLAAARACAAPVPEAVARTQEIARAILQLADPSADTRDRAARTLSAAGGAAVPALEQALRGADPRTKPRIEAVLAGLAARQQAGAEVHVVGVYTARGGRAVVRVGRTPRPVVLVLCAYDPVSWEVETEAGPASFGSLPPATTPSGSAACPGTGSPP